MKPKVRLSPSAKAKLIDLTEDDSEAAKTTTKLLGKLSTAELTESEMEVKSGDESEGHVSSVEDFEGDEIDVIEKSDNESEEEDESLVTESDSRDDEDSDENDSEISVDHSSRHDNAI